MALSPDRNPLEANPMTRRKLQVELAHGSDSQTRLAEKYGVTQPAISAFATRHAEKIKEIRENAQDEFAGIEIAKKQFRLEVYAELLDKALSPTPKVAGAKGNVLIDPNTGEFVYEINEAAASRVLKQVAEELGHLPNRVTLGGEVGVKTNYTIDGVDPGALK